MEEPLIHPTALIDSKAELGQNVSVGPYTVIGPDAVIGDNTTIENHVTIKGHTTIGSGNIIGPYTSIGLPPQDKTYNNEPTKVIIGNNNDIREYVSIHRGTTKEEGITKIGNNNQIFIGVHFAHDTTLGDNCMLANNTTLGGHVEIGSNVVTGGLSGMHQFCRVGDYALVGSMSAIYQDVPPYVLSSGPRASAYGINKVGLERNGFSKEEIGLIQKIYDIYFSKNTIPSKSRDMIQEKIPDGEIKARFLDFLDQSRRGIISKG